MEDLGLKPDKDSPGLDAADRLLLDAFGIARPTEADSGSFDIETTPISTVKEKWDSLVETELED